MTTPGSLAELAKLPAEEVDPFFAGCDAETLVALVDKATDDELVHLAKVDHIRASAVRHVLARLSEFAIADRIAKVQGTAHFEVTTSGGAPEVHALLFDGGTVRVVPLEEREPDVVISTDVLSFLRLVSGGRNAAILLIGGSLTVRGDEMLALQVGGVFQVPGQPGVAVDPAEVDPVAVARVLKHTKDDQLRAVMGGGFRAVVLEQVFTRFPEFLDQDRSAGLDLTIGFKITGRPEGGADRYVVHVVDGRCEVDQAPAEGSPRDATLTLSGGDFLKLVTGHLNPVRGVMRGSIKVRGDVKAALKLHAIMDIPSA